MNGVHDMGGMHGFGPVLPEANEPVFHAPWEASVRGMLVLTGAWRRWNIDVFRHAIERLPPADYLRFSYFEKWLDAMIALLLDTRLITAEELSIGLYRRDVAVRPRFAAGDQVRARNINPEGHTRLPRYVRGHVGMIERDHGAHVFPDSNARRAGEAPQTLYTVRFTARELWGDAANPADQVSLDLWEDYLESA